LSERRVQVVPEVVDVLAAGAEAQQPGGDVFLPGELAAPLDGAFHAAQAGGVDDVRPRRGGVWCDDAGVTCRRWNWRQARRTQLREDTSTALFILDALSSMSLAS
jgi:hypothetical protein